MHLKKGDESLQLVHLNNTRTERQAGTAGNGPED